MVISGVSRNELAGELPVDILLSANAQTKFERMNVWLRQNKCLSSFCDKSLRPNTAGSQVTSNV